MVIRADAMAMPIRDAVAQCVVTSPPYLGQRVYGDSPQLEIGREDCVDDFCIAMRSVGHEVRRILRADGIWWLNLGDKANGSGGAGGDYNAGGGKDGKPRYGKFHDPDYEVGQFLDVPGKVVTWLQLHGWRLRQHIIWDKGVESRESLDHVNRPRTSHESILMLQPGPGRCKFYPERLPETGSVWHFHPANRGEKKNHQAPFPDELARRCILASSDPGDLVVDPFVGSGTTTRVAEDLGRRALGLDIYTDGAT
jgi:DNA modification methylase